MADAADVAQWMFETVTRQRELDQQDAAYQIQERFGDDFVYWNDRGTLSIHKDVLKQFRKLSEDSVVWERGYRAWRLRTPNDPVGRRQADY